MKVLLRRLWTEDKGQDIAEYAVTLAAILVLVVGPGSAHRLQCQQRLLERGERAAISGSCETKARREALLMSCSMPIELMPVNGRCIRPGGGYLQNRKRRRRCDEKPAKTRRPGL